MCSCDFQLPAAKCELTGFQYITVDESTLEFLMSRTEKVRKLAGFIWSIAELLRGDYKQADYGKGKIT